jgi:glycosyltransferase involved in cell wall biosynthesis
VGNVPSDQLVTIALPIYNGAGSIANVAKSVLAQDHENIELLISDNGSTDATEEIGRELAGTDSRVTYHRQPENVGLVNNFVWTKQHARGSFIRWIGDGDEISPNYVSRCLDLFDDDPRLILVNTRLGYVDELGQISSMGYDAKLLASDDPAVRFEEMLALLTRTYQLLDPLYGMARREVVATIPQDQVLKGDEVYAARLALAGPWGYVPELLGQRNWNMVMPTRLAKVLEVPPSHARIMYLIQTRLLLKVVGQSTLTPAQRRRAQLAAIRLYGRRHRVSSIRRGRKLLSRAGIGNRPANAG